MAKSLGSSMGSFCANCAFMISHYSSLALLVLMLLTPAANGHEEATGGGGGGTSTSFREIYAWGDSLTDTGNSLLYQLSIDVDATEGHLPYGETFFHYPTGRWSDGRLVVDFLAQHVEAPNFLVPYLALNETETNCLINFAVGGATAQNVDYLNATYNVSIDIPYSIDKQLDWFSTLPISKDKETFSKALVYFGEIGVNDYNHALENGLSVEEIITEFVPTIMTVIQNASEFLIASGAKYLVIVGGYPVGCAPMYTKYLYPNGTIDQYGCVEELQTLREVHDKLLKELVHNLTIKYTEDVQIIFFDQVKAYGEILKHPSHYGFNNTIDPCFDAFNLLNLTTKEACSRPSTYLSWDGLHFTEAAYMALFNLFNTRGFVTPYPNFLTPKSFRDVISHPAIAYRTAYL